MSYAHLVKTMIGSTWMLVFFHSKVHQTTPYNIEVFKVVGLMQKSRLDRPTVSIKSFHVRLHVGFSSIQTTLGPQSLA